MANFFAMPISKYHDADRLRALGPQSDQWVPIVGSLPLLYVLSFAFIWAALALYTADNLLAQRRAAGGR